MILYSTEPIIQTTILYLQRLKKYSKEFKLFVNELYKKGDQMLKVAISMTIKNRPFLIILSL
jgi:hypothetical protein